MHKEHLTCRNFFFLCQVNGMAVYNSSFLFFVPSEKKKKNNLSSFQKKKKLSLFCKRLFLTVALPQAFGHGGLWEPLAKRRPVTLPSSVIALLKVTPNHNTQHLSREQQGLCYSNPTPHLLHCAIAPAHCL